MNELARLQRPRSRLHRTITSIAAAACFVLAANPEAMADLSAAYAKLERLRNRYARECSGAAAQSASCQRLLQEIEHLEDALAIYNGGERLAQHAREVATRYRSECTGGRSDASVRCRWLRQRLRSLLKSMKSDYAANCQGSKASTAVCRSLEGAIEELEALVEPAASKLQSSLAGRVGGIDLTAIRMTPFGHDQNVPSSAFLFATTSSTASQSAAVAQPALRLARAALSCGLSLPAEVWWVNLHPSEPERVVDPRLDPAVAEVMLEADLALKQSIARLTDPRLSSAGRVYWDRLERLYSKSHQPIAQSTRVWIVPGRVVVAADAGREAHLVEATLKVQSELTYWAAKWPKPQGTCTMNAKREAGNLFHEIVLPHLERLVNEDASFASLRQVFRGLVLARWAHSVHIAVPSALTTGRGLPSPGWTPQRTWEAYVRSLHDGEYSFSDTTQHDEKDLRITETRHYFSGGVDLTEVRIQATDLDLERRDSFSCALRGSEACFSVRENSRLIAIVP